MPRPLLNVSQSDYLIQVLIQITYLITKTVQIQIIWLLYITKTYLYNFDHLKVHFCIVKLGFTGVYIIFLISAQNLDCGYSLELPHRGGSNEYHNLGGSNEYHNLGFGRSSSNEYPQSRF